MAGLRADQIALYTKDMYKAEREGYKEEAVVYPDIYKVKSGDVTGAGHKETQILGAGDLARHTVEGQDIVYKSPVQGWEYLVRYWTYSDGISLTKEAVEDTVKLGNLLKDLASTWGRSVRVEKETFCARAFNNGGALSGDYVFNGTHTGQTDASGDLLYDSKPLFNLVGNTRATKMGSTYYNSVAGLTVTPDDFETLYNLATSTNNKDERDRIIQNNVDTALTRPGADAFKMSRILDTTKGLPGGQLNDKNVYYGIIKKHLIWHYLTASEGAFFLGKAQHPDFQFHERQMSEIRMFRDEKNLGYKASINVRWGSFFKNFRPWVRGGGTSA